MPSAFLAGRMRPRLPCRSHSFACRHRSLAAGLLSSSHAITARRRLFTCSTSHTECPHSCIPTHDLVPRLRDLVPYMDHLAITQCARATTRSLTYHRALLRTPHHPHSLIRLTHYAVPHTLHPSRTPITLPMTVGMLACNFVSRVYTPTSD